MVTQEKSQGNDLFSVRFPKRKKVKIALGKKSESQSEKIKIILLCPNSTICEQKLDQAFFS